MSNTGFCSFQGRLSIDSKWPITSKKIENVIKVKNKKNNSPGSSFYSLKLYWNCFKIMDGIQTDLKVELDGLQKMDLCGSFETWKRFLESQGILPRSLFQMKSWPNLNKIWNIYYLLESHIFLFKPRLETFQCYIVLDRNKSLWHSWLTTVYLGKTVVIYHLLTK